MPLIHAWDCRCGQRSAPTAAFCQNCGAPQASGQPVLQVEPPEADSPRPFPWALLLWPGVLLFLFAFLRLGPWDAVLAVLAALSLMPWPVFILILVVSLLVRIARAAERIGR